MKSGHRGFVTVPAFALGFFSLWLWAPALQGAAAGLGLPGKPLIPTRHAREPRKPPASPPSVPPCIPLMQREASCVGLDKSELACWEPLKLLPCPSTV